MMISTRSTHPIVGLLVLGLLFSSGDAFADSNEPVFPPIEAGQTWRYLVPPDEYGPVAMIQSVSGASALVAVRDLVAGTEDDPAYQLVRIRLASLQLSLEGPGRPMGQMPSAGEHEPYACGAQPLAQCLHTIHSLRSLKAEDLYDR